LPSPDVTAVRLIESVAVPDRFHHLDRDQLVEAAGDFAIIAELDLDARTVKVAGAQAALTRHEFDLLSYLVERPARAVSRAQLAERTLSAEEPPDPRTVDTHVARIRKKIGQEASMAIVTVWGIGYRFEPESARTT